MKWSENDQDKALAWQVEQDGKCPGCGLQLSETTHPDSEEAYEATAIRCHACVERERESGRFEGPKARRGLLVSVVDLREG